MELKYMTDVVSDCCKIIFAGPDFPPGTTFLFNELVSYYFYCFLKGGLNETSNVT